MEKTLEIQLAELRERIAKNLEQTKSYEIETEGGGFNFIPQFIAAAIARGTK